ncbi:MAG: RdgB/HAM1 family non-canonical purine NTP pyrophosphatase [Anaerolineae bacterium]
MDLLLGTHNKGKLREYKALLAEASVNLLLLDDMGLTAFDVEETGTTFEANALLKAQAYAKAGGIAAMADDTGLEVDALDGRPGVYSARYGSSDRQRCEKLLAELAHMPDEQRSARFVCVIAVAQPDKDAHLLVRGTVEGRIAQAIGGGSEGFGYDAVFIPDGYDVTWSAIPLTEKNRISHRGEAARKLIPLLKEQG